MAYKDDFLNLIKDNDFANQNIVCKLNNKHQKTIQTVEKGPGVQ